MSGSFASPGGWAGTDGPQAAFSRRSLGGFAVVVVLHLLLFWALLSGLAQRMVEVIRSPIEARLIEDRPPPPPPPPALPPPTTAPPPTAQQMPVPTIAPLPTATQVPVPVQAAPPPPPASPPPVEAPRPVAVQPTITAPPAPAAPAHNPDAAYISELRAYLNSIKRYPTSREARQLRPEGTVRVWIELDRAGQLLGAGIEASAGSLLIDNEALRTVRNGRFPPFAADAFAGQASHRFVVPIEYLPGG
jgi:protein TonB